MKHAALALTLATTLACGDSPPRGLIEPSMPKLQPPAIDTGVELVSSGPGGETGRAPSDVVSISADGDRVTFRGRFDSPGLDHFVHQRSEGRTRRIPVDPDVGGLVTSDDGTWVAYSSCTYGPSCRDDCELVLRRPLRV